MSERERERERELEASRDTTNEGTSGGQEFHAVGFVVSSVGYAVARRFREVLAPVQLEPREFALLRAASTREGCSQQTLAERLRIPPSRMVAFVDALEGRGLLERRADPDDRRRRALYLTDTGRTTLERALVLATEYERQLCAGLSEAERETLIDLVQRVGAELGLVFGETPAHSAWRDQ
ncbi:MAG: MarR family transcriptional regulator [Solirubrobacterales bacterium]|nr:MarR family transcriptional regulator [Solirubrobacterales bacterium]